MTDTQVIENQTSDKVSPDQTTWKFWKKRRYIVLLMVFLGMSNVNIIKVTVSMGIVAMTTNRTFIDSNGLEISESEFNWNSREIGYILSSYFYGFILTQFLGGYYANRIGGNVIFSTTLGISSILTLLIPICAKTGYYYFLVVRVLQGLCAGVSFPCVFEIYLQWAPTQERGKFISIGYSGLNFGTLICTALGGILTRNTGWESSYYVFGSFGIVWYLFWIKIVKRQPSMDRKIKIDELRYIEGSRNKTNMLKSKNIPWKSILTSLVFYSLLVASFAQNWGFFTMLLHLPSFLTDTLSTNLQNSGFVSAAPYLVYSIVLPLAGYINDRLTSGHHFTKTQIIKYSTCLGFMAQAVFVILVAHLENAIGVVISVILTVSLGAFPFTAYSVNFLEIAPEYTTVLMGICQTFSTLSGIISPTVTGYIVQNKANEEWQIVFYIMALIYLIGCVFFWFFSSAELQHWAKSSSNITDQIITQTDRRNNSNIS